MSNEIVLEVVREDPPTSGAGRPRVPTERYAKTAETLKADPGEWYRIASGQRYPELAARIRTGKITAFLPAKSFETKSRKIDGLHTVWARYVGEE